MNRRASSCTEIEPDLTKIPNADLKKVYQVLNTRLVMERKDTEVTFVFAAVGAALLLLSLLLSFLWFNRAA